jgi:hypothetical protein
MYDLIIIFDKFILLPKAPLPIVLTDSGIIISVKLGKPLIAFCEILLISLPMTMYLS